LDDMVEMVADLPANLAKDQGCREEDVDEYIGATPSRDTIHRIIGDPTVPPNVKDLVAVAVSLARRARRLPAGKKMQGVAVFTAEVEMLWRRACTADPGSSGVPTQLETTDDSPRPASAVPLPGPEEAQHRPPDTRQSDAP
jgi:hypothetical protein